MVKSKTERCILLTDMRAAGIAVKTTVMLWLGAGVIACGGGPASSGASGTPPPTPGPVPAPGPGPAPGPDTTPPVLSNVFASPNTPNQIVVSFDTNEPAIGSIDVGLTRSWERGSRMDS